MKRRNRIVTAVIGGVLGGAATAMAAGAFLWNRATARAVERLPPLAPDAAAEPRTFSREQLAGLPAPVVRYFEFALTPGQPLIRTARIEHAGEFRSGLDAPWAPFTSVQHFSADPPGFVWDAAIHMSPILTVRVRDGYFQGAGSMQARIASLIPVVNAEGGRELAEGALQRWLAESVWFPTALLPRKGLTWEPIDETCARATLTDSGVSVSFEFRFGEEGEVVGVYTPARYRDVDGKPVPTPWAGSFRSYGRVGAVRVPNEGEVAWILPEGRLSYWRGRIVRLEYD
ncbi:MAG: DUF6544 family protein [Acidobacteriota bacterium]